MMRAQRITMAAAPVALLAALVGATPAAAAQADRPQRILAVFSGHDGVENPTKVIASGPVSGAGFATQTLTGETPEGESGQVTFHLGDGDLMADFVERNFRLEFNQEACTASTTSDGTMQVVGGTGTFAGAAGALTFTTSGRIVGARGQGGRCLAMSAPPKNVLVTLTATGHVTLAG